jgi:hypothetical protein
LKLVFYTMHKLLDKLEQNKIHISLVNGDLKVKFNTPAISEELLNSIRQNKTSLIEYLKSF